MDLGLFMIASPIASVIIPHYRDLLRLNLCLVALGRQSFPANHFEVIVSDNASPEGEAAVARVVAGRARLVVTAEPGAGPARNAGAAVARGRILAFIDSDCIAEPDWLREGVEALEVYDFVGGRVKVLVEDEQRMTAAEAFERVFAFDFERYIRQKGFTGSGNLFCPRTLFEAVGGFGVGISEDVDWSHRARSAGYRLGYAPRAIVGHPARRTWSELTRKWRRTNAEAYGLFKRKPAGRLRWLARSCLLPASAIVHTPRVFACGELRSWRQRILAVGTLFRHRLWRFVDALRLLADEERA